MSKHTPGPWTIVEHSWARTGIYAKHIGIAALDIEGDADEATQHEWEALMSANARLIAAAPDLLAALQEMTPRFQDLRELAGFGESALTREAHAAIAKATGEGA